MNENRRSILPGILLILIGMWILSNRFFPDFGIWEHIYPFFLLGFGVFHFVEWSRTKREKTFFWGVFFLLAGAFFILRNFDYIPYLYFDEYWPVFMVIWGLSYFARFVIRPNDWGVLIPSVIFIFIGVVLFLNTAEGVIGDFHLDLEKYWPVGLILIGCGIVVSAFFKSKDAEIE